MSISHRLQLAAVMTAAALLYLAHSLLRFRNFEAKGYDLGIFDQAVRQYSLLKAPIVPIKGEDFHLLGDHFHPIIAAFAPLYWIWDDPRVLNIGMIALLVSTALPVYLVVRGWFSHLPALLAAVALLLFWPFQALVNWDFHEIAFGVPLVAWVIWAIERRRMWLAVGLGAVLLLVREDMGVTLIALSLVFALKRAWLPALVTAALGVFGYWFAVELVIPHFSAAGEFGYWEFTALGPSAGAAIIFLLTQPWNAVVILFDHPTKVGLWALHFLPLLLLPLASPYAILGAPILLSRLFNDRANVWSVIYQYDAILAPIFLLAGFDVARRIIARWPRLRPLAVGLPGTVIAVGLVGTLAFPGVFPLQRTVTADNWTMGERALAHQQVTDAVPDGVCVEAADTAVPHLVDRTSVGLNGTTDEDALTWIIIDDTVEELGGSNPLSPEEAFVRAERLGFEPVIEDAEGLWLMHRASAVDSAAASDCAEYLRR
ncbi:DUF2079 domain-containing protein [Nesterenkonia sp. AY15]|uniref:DUF2079 domain-containing protein n=1 Tax=Nesterenkonia sp. AY15 TaxID=2901139 RepID=UPI001F4CFA4C|nr:DUF2079 domain-containing protein [Nesterenkonia sp. AY15]MCH8571220.1 DUF2079 domain-containing protein [Nesterenkonia sp. AY15]